MQFARAGDVVTETGERVALVAVAVGDAAATVWLGVRERVAVAATVAVGDAVAVDVGAEDAVEVGAGDAPLGVAQALVSCVSTERHTDRALASHVVPSVAVRDNATRMKG